MHGAYTKPRHAQQAVSSPTKLRKRIKRRTYQPAKYHDCMLPKPLCAALALLGIVGTCFWHVGERFRTGEADVHGMGWLAG